MSSTEHFKIRRIDHLFPYEDNARTQNKQGFAALAESIEKFGVEEGAPCSFQPVIVNVHPDFNDTIIGGQRRVEASVAAGYEEVWVREVVLDRAEMEEFNVRLNVPAGDWDWELLVGVGGEKLLSWGFEDLELPNLPPEEPLDMDFNFDGGDVVPPSPETADEIAAQRMTDVATTEFSAGQNDAPGEPISTPEFDHGSVPEPGPRIPVIPSDERRGRQINFFLFEDGYDLVTSALDFFVGDEGFKCDNRSEALVVALDFAKEAVEEARKAGDE